MAGYWTELKRADEALHTEARTAWADLQAAARRFNAADGGCCPECFAPQVYRRASDVARRFEATFGYLPY